jgi:uncharacterized membrane protein
MGTYKNSKRLLQMLASLDLWIEYIIRFSHVVAGISWIGSSFYFIWLDGAFETPEKPRHNVDGEVFMVHGGFYYQVDKRKIYPGEIPKTLHWFKWEATLTFITGFMLFGYLYFLNDAILLIDKSVLDLSQWQAILLSLGIIISSWFTYDFIYHPKEMINRKVANILALIFSLALIWGLTYIFSGRGTFIMVGVTYGSCMLLNVWVRILPNQAKMLQDAENGKVPDYTLGQKSKVRSVHNTFFIFPVLFIMLSNHYPEVYNHQYNWILLLILMVSGGMFRFAMVTKVPKQRLLVIPAAIGLLSLVAITAKKPKLVAVESGISYQEIAPIVKARCLACHSSNNTDDVYKEAQKGVNLETEELLYSNRAKALVQVSSKVMPLGNKTGMRRKERAKLVKYLEELQSK